MITIGVALSDELDDVIDETEVCENCDGSGRVEDPDNPGEIIDDPVCEGNGFIRI